MGRLTALLGSPGLAEIDEGVSKGVARVWVIGVNGNLLALITVNNVLYNALTCIGRQGEGGGGGAKSRGEGQMLGVIE